MPDDHVFPPESPAKPGQPPNNRPGRLSVRDLAGMAPPPGAQAQVPPEAAPAPGQGPRILRRAPAPEPDHPQQPRRHAKADPEWLTEPPARHQPPVADQRNGQTPANDWAEPARSSQPASLEGYELAPMDPAWTQAAAPQPHYAAPRAEHLQQPAPGPRPRVEQPMQAAGHPQQQPPYHDGMGAPRATAEAPSAVPTDFPYEKEHPLLKIPFTVHMDGRRFEGETLSVTHMILRSDGEGPLGRGHRTMAWLYVAFDSFGIALQPDVIVLDDNPDGSMVLQFASPTGPHLPQLRYILNSYIAGDVVSVDGMLSYTGPDAPKAPKANTPDDKKQRKRSIGMLVLSSLMVVAAAGLVYKRYTTGTEMHPVFVERAGAQMRATVAGQIGYLNADAGNGEVVYAINATTGDVLNFQMPCDCEVALAPGIAQGTTVLPEDVVLTAFSPDAGLRVETLMSVQGLNRAMRGDNVSLALNDGRTVPVMVIPGEATHAATIRGEVFVPVTLQPKAGGLTHADLGKSAQLRITPNLAARLGLR